MEENQNPTQQPVPVISPTAPVSTPPASSPPPIVKKSAKFSIKAIISLIIFLLLAGGAAASFTVFRPQIMSLVAKPTPTPTVVISPTPTPDPTADWETYEGEGFSFKYSPEWSYTSEAGTLFFSKKVREPQPTGPFENLPTNTTVRLQISKKTQNETLENWATNETVRRGVTEFIPVIKKVKAAGVNAIETDFPSMHGERLTVFIMNDTVFVINLEYATPEDETIQKKFKDQILSTFKFTDAQTLDSSNWTTFNNIKFGFSLKYPPDWEVTDNSFSQPNYSLYGVNVSSPLKYDLKGYETIGYRYLMGINFDGLVPKISSENGFIKGYEKGDQATENVNLGDDFVKNSEEYKIAQEIFKTAKKISN